jgi:hypothetical protein
LPAEHTFTISLPPDEVLPAVARAFGAAGFSNVQVNDSSRMVTGDKRVFGQWTKDQAAAFVDATPEGSTVKVTSKAKAQSLGAILGTPSKLLVRDVVFAIADQFKDTSA